MKATKDKKVQNYEITKNRMQISFLIAVYIVTHKKNLFFYPELDVLFIG